MVTTNSPYASAKATISRLKQFDVYTCKSLGQHFLVDDGTVGKILRLANLESGDTVLEVGPGIGTLTEAMLGRGAMVLAIEKDQRLEPALADIKHRFAQTFDYKLMDILDFIKNVRDLQKAKDLQTEQNTCKTAIIPQKMIANLPYAVAATLVLEAVLEMPALASLTVMVQKEVAQRMMAQPNSKSYGAYTVKLQLLMKYTGSFNVAPSCFLPPPRVDSTVIRLERQGEHPAGYDIRAAFAVTEAAFANRRKTIRNSMQARFKELDLDAFLVDELLSTARLSTNIRGESLEPQQFLELGQIFTHILQDLPANNG